MAWFLKPANAAPPGVVLSRRATLLHKLGIEKLCAHRSAPWSMCKWKATGGGGLADFQA